MTDLEFCYNQPLKALKYINRKASVISPKTLIIGAIGSGKSSMIGDYLSAFKQDERLYINLDDMRIDRLFVLENLKDFLAKNNKIKAVAVDGLCDGEFGYISGLECEHIVLATSFVDAYLQGFATLNLGYLDYEEFIAFFSKNLDENMLFSHFLAHSNSPKTAFLDASEVSLCLQDDLRCKLSQNEIILLTNLAQRCGENISLYEIFKSLKGKIKISKDSIYTGFAKLEKNGYILAIEKFNEAKAAKKVYLKNFGFRNALNAKKDFGQVFANVVFCELAKFKEQIFYTKDFDFFLAKRKLAIACIPFSASEIIFLKFKKLHPVLKSYGVTKFQVISVANSGVLSIEGIKCEIIAFSRWALGI
ncbi:MAG: ATP-binding protein [Campylobacter sp.]|nr:ATP-binding protein [Campylobacter sp.]